MSNERFGTVVFTVGDNYYGIQIDQVISIERTSKLNQIAMMPEYVSIATLQRGIVTTVDLRIVLNLETKMKEIHNVVLVKIKESTIGFIVDDVEDIFQISNHDIYPISVLHDDKISFIVGLVNINNLTLILIDPEKFLAEMSDQDMINRLHEFV